MKLEIVRYTDQYRSDWDKLVDSSVNGTFLHKRSFYDHNPLNANDDCSFLYLKKNRITGVVPCTLFQRNDKNILQSHLRSTFGGFVINDEVGVEEALEIVEQLVSEARKLNVDEIIIRNPFRIFNQSLCDETDYAMWYQGFKIRSREVEIAVDISKPLETIKSKYYNGNKYNIKKAVKHITVTESTDFRYFWEILEKNLNDKHGKSPVHSLEDIARLITCVGADKVKLFAAYHDSKMVCGMVLFVTSAKAIHAQYIGLDEDFQEYRPLNVLIDFVIEWGHKAGYQYFNLGTANENEGRDINQGLFYFKESFGGRGVLRETMALTLQ